MLHHISDNLEAAFRIFKVSVLNAGLDNIQGRGYEKWCWRSDDRSDEVLEPRCWVIVVQFVEIFLCKGRSSEKLIFGLAQVRLITKIVEWLRLDLTYSEGSRGISGCGPTGATIETHSFIGHDSKDASTSKCFRIRLALYFEYVQR